MTTTTTTTTTTKPTLSRDSASSSIERSFAGLPILSGAPSETGICMAVYGAGGVGKTTFLAEVVHSTEYGAPALLIDVEGGSSSVLHLVPHGLDIVQVQRWSDIVNLLRAVDSDASPYKSIIIDNVSELQSVCMRSITTSAPQIQHWGEMTANMLRLVRTLRDLSRFRRVNALFSVWEERHTDDEVKLLVRSVNLTPKFAAAFPGIVTMVGHLSVLGNDPQYTRRLTFAPSPRLDSKYRVSPREHAAKIPLEVYIRSDQHFLADFLATVNDARPFPATSYGPPVKGPRRDDT